MEEIAKYTVGSTSDMVQAATELATFIKDRKLSVKISGKEYVLAEGWQFAGAQFGIISMIKSCERQASEEEIRYRCEAELISIRSNLRIGYGIAICSNKEVSKKYYDEYAICSMAQTRAIAKAYRNAFAWLMKAAGYEATPAEEMKEEENQPSKPKAGEIDWSNPALGEIKKRISSIKNSFELKAWWKKHASDVTTLPIAWQSEIKAALTEKKSEVTKK